MRHLYCLAVALLCCAATLRAEDAKVAEEHRKEGIVALQESQHKPREIVTAARHFAKAAAIFEQLGDADGAVEMNSFLYWCKKKMNLEDIEAFTKAGEAVVTEKLKAVETQKVEKTDAQTWYDRAETFAKNKPDEHLLIAIRFFEVADRFKGTDISLKAQGRSLDEQQLASAQAAKPKPTPLDEPRIGPAKPAVEAAAKAAVPDAAKLKEAEKTIKDLFKDEFAKKGVDDKKALGQKLFQQASDTKDDLVSRYVLLKEAAAASALGADAETALKALDALGQSYELDALALKADTLAKIVPSTADAAKALARVYIKAIDDAVTADNYDAAVKFAAAADAVARKAQDMPLVTQLQARSKEVRALQADFAKVKAAQATLKDKPDDLEANLAVGKFLCFSKNQWEDGLPVLGKCNDAKLKTLAQKELAKPTEVDAQLSIADEWLEYFEKQTASGKPAVALHAFSHYSDVHMRSSGLVRARIEKRLQSLPTPSCIMNVWNCNNGGLGGFGALEFDVVLSNDSSAVWTHKAFVIPYKPEGDSMMTLLLPPLQFSRVKIEVTRSVQYAGFNEIEIMRNGKNIAAGCAVTTNSTFDNDPKFGADKVTDGITSAKTSRGYWITARKPTGWVEIDLTKKTEPTKK